MRKNPVSALMIFLLFVGLIAGRLWKPNLHPISWDVGGYYLYLPAGFIYHDLGIHDYNKFDSLRVKYEVSSTFYQVYKTPKEKRIIKYTMGNSVLYAPFFFTGHLIAKAGGYPADGFSEPYQQSLLWGTLMYAALALWFARKILLHFFKDGVTAFTLFSIVMGTNLFFILSMDNLQSHYNLFFLYTLLIWTTIRYHDRPSYSRAIVLGAFAGLIILTRPTDIVSWLIPILWGVGSLKDAWNKLTSHFKYFVVFGIIAAIVFLPQMIYWKIFAGSWLYNSYDNPGEGLDLWSPHTLPFLFSYRKGWLVYTPLVLLAIAGIFISIKHTSKVFLSLFLFFILNLWLVSSWTCWWYAGSFSSRAMVQSYAVLMIPLGFFISYISTRSRNIQLAGKTIVLMVVFLSMFQTWQYAEGILKMDGMTKAFYWRAFGAVKYKPENDRYVLKNKLLETDTIPDPENYLVSKEYTFNWENPAKIAPDVYKRLVPGENGTGYCLKIDSGQVFFTLFEKEYKSLTDKYYAYARVEGDIKNTGAYAENPVELVRTMVHKGGLYFYSSTTILKENDAELNTWNHFKIDYIFPDIRSSSDKFKTYFWLRGTQPVFFKNLKVQVLEARNFPELE
jgi:hypothetical protein